MNYKQLKEEMTKATETLSPLHKDSKPLRADYKRNGEGVIIICANERRAYLKAIELEVAHE